MKRFSRTVALLALGLLLVMSPGCDFTRMITAPSSAEMFGRASGGLERHFDYELVGDGMPSSILTMEGIFAVIPENEPLGVNLMRVYVSYGYGWVEDEMQRAGDAGDLEEEERLTGRARLLYERGRNVGIHLMRLRDPNIDQVLQGGHAGWVEYLETHFTSQADVPILFWTGYAWGSAINAGRDDPEMVLNLPFARSLVERAVALDRTYFNHSGLTFLAVVNASLPEALGGDPEAARAGFEEVLQLTDRKFFTVQVSYARTYAVMVQDRNLFIRLLREVIDGGDPEPSARLANRVARRQAILWLNRVDQLF